MQNSDTPNWDRHLILAELKRRYGSLSAFAKTTGLSVGHFSVALDRSYPKAEQLIADALDEELQVLWPDRYDSRGRRRSNNSSRASDVTSQNVRRAS